MTLARLSKLIPKNRLHSTTARCLLQPNAASVSFLVQQQTQKRCFSDSITYSGGQASAGQGGYYGSGGARAIGNSDNDAEACSTTEQRSKMLALASDVEKITMVMNEVELLQNLLEEDREEHNGEVTNRSIELRGQMKHLMTSPQFLECLDRLEIMGAPIWGLSSEEHDLIQFARQQVNSC